MRGIVDLDPWWDFSLTDRLIAQKCGTVREYKTRYILHQLLDRTDHRSSDYLERSENDFEMENGMFDRTFWHVIRHPSKFTRSVTLQSVGNKSHYAVSGQSGKEPNWSNTYMEKNHRPDNFPARLCARRTIFRDAIQLVERVCCNRSIPFIPVHSMRSIQQYEHGTMAMQGLLTTRCDRNILSYIWTKQTRKDEHY